MPLMSCFASLFSTFNPFFLLLFILPSTLKDFLVPVQTWVLTSSAPTVVVCAFRRRLVAASLDFKQLK